MKLIVIGARADGQAHLVLDAIEATGEHAVVAFADETPGLPGKRLFERPIFGWPLQANDHFFDLGITGAVIAIGNGLARFRLAGSCRKFGIGLPSIVHPAAGVSRYARIGEGVFVGQGAQILAGAVIGDLALINAGAVVSHHATVGTATTVGPNVTLAGRSSIRAYVLLGAGSTLRPDVTVGESAVVGAGSAVVSDVTAGITVAGVPARPLR